MSFDEAITPARVLHWNYRGFTEFPIQQLTGEEHEITDIYLKENLISQIPNDIGKLENLESLYLSGNDILQLPKDIAKLRCLKCLDVSGNRLRCIPDEIGAMVNLKYLILDENELCELPLRLSDLKMLRYLSVCDNNLEWLSQRPVYNYHHCELRLWRNSNLMTIPYSLWYHMFREQQNRCSKMGSLNIPQYSTCHSSNSKCRLKLSKDSREWEIHVSCPPQYANLLDNTNVKPPSLFELCLRKFYQIICDTVKSSPAKYRSTNADNNLYNNTENYCCAHDNIMGNLGEDLEAFNITNGWHNHLACDINGNNYDLKVIPTVRKNNTKTSFIRNTIDCDTPADIVERYFDFLPKFIKIVLSNGPVSKCENIDCKNPIFDYVFYEFTFGKMILIDNTEEVILSAAFCSKSCKDTWRKNKTNLIQWTLS